MTESLYPGHATAVENREGVEEMRRRIHRLEGLVSELSDRLLELEGVGVSRDDEDVDETGG